MAQKAKRSISALDPHASYEAKARYYECYSTQELLAAGGYYADLYQAQFAGQEQTQARIDAALGVEALATV